MKLLLVHGTHIKWGLHLKRGYYYVFVSVLCNIAVMMAVYQNCRDISLSLLLSLSLHRENTCGSFLSLPLPVPMSPQMNTTFLMAVNFATSISTAWVDSCRPTSSREEGEEGQALTLDLPQQRAQPLSSPFQTTPHPKMVVTLFPVPVPVLWPCLRGGVSHTLQLPQIF